MPTYSQEAVQQRVNELLAATGHSAREIERRAKAKGYQVVHAHISHIASGKAKRAGAHKLEAIAVGFGFPSLDAMMAPDAVQRVKAGTQGAVNDSPSVDRESLRSVLREELAAAGVRPTGREIGGLVRQRRRHSSNPRPIVGAVAAAQILRGLVVGDWEDEREAPGGFEDAIGPNGVGVVIQGTSLSGLGIQPRDVAWINPDEQHVVYRSGDVVIASARSDESDEPKPVIKQVRSWEGREGLWSNTTDEDELLDVNSFDVLARVICIETPDGQVFVPGREQRPAPLALHEILLGRAEEALTRGLFDEAAATAGDALESVLFSLAERVGAEPDSGVDVRTLVELCAARGALSTIEKVQVSRWAAIRNAAVHLSDRSGRRTTRDDAAQMVAGVRSFIVSKAAMSAVSA